ncbi:MAG: helix-turn-helix domain-containing protein, partial [Plesiomonas shigelloides]
PLHVDVRIIAATHQDLEARVREGLFREDLFHRLNVIRLQLPALRERRQDIAALSRHFLLSAARELGVEAKTLHPDTLRVMSEFHWPGNVRQLENICRGLTVMAAGKEIFVSDLPAELTRPTSSVDTAASALNWQQPLQQWVLQQLARGQEDLLTTLQPEFEQLLLDAALQHTRGHKQEAARLLGWGRNTLTRKLKELGIH